MLSCGVLRLTSKEVAKTVSPGKDDRFWVNPLLVLLQVEG